MSVISVIRTIVYVQVCRNICISFIRLFSSQEDCSQVDILVISLHDTFMTRLLVTVTLGVQETDAQNVRDTRHRRLRRSQSGDSLGHHLKNKILHYHVIGYEKICDVSYIVSIRPPR